MAGWYPWYYDDYERDAGHLDHISDSCYRRIIDFYMRTREPIPRDPIRLMFITRTSGEQFAAVWPRLQGFFTEVNGVLHLKRCNTELDRQDNMTRHKSLGGKRSAEKRRQQYQLLTNSSSTAVQLQLNSSSTDSAATGHKRREEEDHKNDAGASAKGQLFTACLTWLAALNGKDPEKYRGLMGRWCRDHGEVETLQAFVKAQRDNPQGDRVAYMTALLRPKPKPTNIGI